MALHRFSWLIENELAGMSHPGHDPDAMAELWDKGIRAIVTLSDDPLPRCLVEEHGFEYLHLPVENFAPPRPRQVSRFIRFCQRQLESGRPVAVHCLAGCGRTGTMLACYLVWKGMPPDKAIEEVRRRRPCSIETEQQEAAVFEYARRRDAEGRSRGKRRRRPPRKKA